MNLSIKYAVHVFSTSAIDSSTFCARMTCILVLQSILNPSLSHFFQVTIHIQLFVKELTTLLN